MPSVTAPLIGGIVAGAGALGSAAISSSAISGASNTAAQTAAADNALQSQIYQSNKAELDPYVTRGNTAGDELNGFLGLGGDPAAIQAAFNTYLNSTGYQFNLNQGLDAVNTDKAVAGELNSGSAVKALDAYGTGLADQEGQQYEQDLQGVVNTGAGSASALAGVGQNFANASNTNSNSAASVAGNAAIAGANVDTSAINSAVNAFGKIAGQSSFGGAGGGGTSGSAYMNAFSYGSPAWAGGA